MSKKLLTMVLLYCCLCNQAFAQTIKEQADSLKNIIKLTTDNTIKIDLYNELTAIYSQNQPKKAIKYGHKALTLSKKIKYDTGYCYEKLFLAHNSAGSHADTLLKYADLLSLYYKKSDYEIMVVNWCYAYYYEYTNQKDKEIEKYITILKIIQASKDSTIKQNEGHVLNNIADLFDVIGRKDVALLYYQKALSKTEDKEAKANMFFNIGIIYNDFNKIDTAQILFDEAYQLYKDVNQLDGIVDVLIERASYKDNKKQFNLANQIYYQALDIIKQNSLRNISKIYHRLAKHYFNRKIYRLSIEYAKKAIQETIRIKNYSTVDELYITLEQAYAAVEDYQSAYEIRGLLMEHIDSINNETLINTITELQTKFELEQKEIENQLLKAKTENADKVIRNQMYAAIGLILALTFAIGWGVFIYKSEQQEKKLNQILEKKVNQRTIELQNSNKNLEQANYELRTFNYIASHDLKEPIRVIGGYVGLIFKKLSPDLKESLGEYFDTIKRSTTQLYTLIEDFANYTTMSKNETIEKQAVDLNLLTIAVVEQLEETLKKYKGVVNVSDLPTIKTGNSLLFTMLKNLIENGLKYNNSETPTVNIDYQKTANAHQIIVSDNGIGIDKQYHEKIFEMFKRLHNRGEYEGSGIGLAIVKLSVEKLGGTVEIESEVGKGSRFVIELPM